MDDDEDYDYDEDGEEYSRRFEDLVLQPGEIVKIRIGTSLNDYMIVGYEAWRGEVQYIIRDIETDQISEYWLYQSSDGNWAV